MCGVGMWNRNSIKALIGFLVALLIALSIRSIETFASSGAEPVASSNVTTITPLEIVGILIILLILTYTLLGCNLLGLTEPLLHGPLVGIVLGLSPQVYLSISAMFQLMFMGLFMVGGAAVPNAWAATISALIFAKVLGYTSAVTPEQLGTLVTLALPIAMLTMYLEILGARAGCAIYHHWADREIERLHLGRIPIIATLGTFQWFVMYAIPVVAVATLGASPAAAEAIKSFVEQPTVKTIFSAISVAAALMPAVGLGLLLKLTYTSAMLPWFLLGYVLVAYLKMPILGIAITVAALIILAYWHEISELMTPTAQATTEVSKPTGIITKGDLYKAYLKTIFGDQWAWSYERMQGTSYLFVMTHIEKKLRKSPEELKAWLKLHNEFFNTHPTMTPVIVGMNIALEEGGADPDTVRAIKTSLMGPLAGFGDSFWWFTWRPIAFGIGVALTQTLGIVGPIVAFIIWFAGEFLATWYLFWIGYRYGLNAITIIKGGRLETIKKIAGALAVAIVAAVGVTYINVKIPITITPPGAAQAISIQSAIDMILPRLIPLIFLLGAFALYRRGWSITKVLALYFVLGFILGLAGILATG